MARTPAKIKVGKIIKAPRATQDNVGRALAELTAVFVALLVKLDADTALDEDDYESTLTPTTQIVL